MARSRSDADYDDYDDRPRQPAGGSNTAVKIIAIIAGVFVVLCLVCGGVIFLIVRETSRAAANMQSQMVGQLDKMQEAQAKRAAELEKSDKAVSKQTAEQFMTEVKARRYDPAYQLTSDAYRKRTTRKEFEAFVTKNFAALTAAGSLMEDHFAADQGTTFVFTRHAPTSDGIQNVSVTVVKEAGAWKVDEVSVTKN
ncbi:MAG: hypothetical protein ACJ8F7_11860 [Gemmataceae bacterium]